MFIGATGFNISNMALVLLGDVPLDLSTSQEVCALTYELSSLHVNFELEITIYDGMNPLLVCVCMCFSAI